MSMKTIFISPDIFSTSGTVFQRFRFKLSRIPDSKDGHPFEKSLFVFFVNFTKMLHRIVQHLPFAGLYIEGYIPYYIQEAPI